MSIALVVTVVLVMGVIFVNGWTDAPNAIATAVSTRVLKPNVAIWIAVAMNFLGALVMTYFNSQVAETISNIVSFEGGGNIQASQVALAASLFSIVVWSVAAWYFGIPTSESHALIAGLTGSAMALGGIGAVNGQEWIKVLIGLVVSTVFGFGGGYLITKLIVLIFTNVRRRTANKFFTIGQATAAAANAFLHGAQDGQKFMGVFMLGLFYNGLAEKSGNGFVIPIWVMALCSLTMGFGTSVGGMKIIKSVGMDMVKLERYQGFSADLSAAICLFAASVFGIPVSTTHTKTTAIMGVGASRRLSSVDWRIVKEMVFAWVMTFPGCGLIAFVMAKLFIAIF
ncbi:inorganic phosphate transporter [Enterococcus asini]|uniref:Inorganic phosphate transporter n=1 Tax=Enterococcus asini TaxID=57732 RepID=A0AAW8TYD8_9ENTE|nr:inorganic phosphate transporter [Enterococcus asini]MCD5029355.1 inorganic phosphate transporter [Enterococcus asini]MDT2743612.1 inorganic phosphate transporter [Enterococcus asini]MDT2764965.1 inorganic phosphate transporter [Enterococcus asini]MDT2809529.1 inorganic phosphate transporter [Enterococcus asini]